MPQVKFDNEILDGEIIAQEGKALKLRTARGDIYAFEGELVPTDPYFKQTSVLTFLFFLNFMQVLPLLLL